MTILLSEGDVGSLLDMKEVVAAVEEAFRRSGTGGGANAMRTRSRALGSVLNVMHANLSYLGRAGVKAYASSTAGRNFVLVLFDARTSAPLAVMGADLLGRYRTGAASGVATRHLYGKRSGTLAILGSGKQALAQVLAVSTVMTVEEVRVWSPSPSRRESFTSTLAESGFNASARRTPADALKGANVASAITSSKEPFLTAGVLGSVLHLNICGSNLPEHSEVSPDAVGYFDTVVVDDLAQAKVEYGDLIQAVSARTFSWDSAVELAQVVTGEHRPTGRTLFKSGGVAVEDVAVASLVYEKALKAGREYPAFELS